jgi:outer membrane protein assembly factor BamB
MVACVLAAAAAATADDQPQWGQRYCRNMVSAETNMPESFDPATGRGVKWTARLGTETYLSPIVAGGRVLIGTNNGSPRDRRHQGDRGILLCLDANDGHLLWQLVVPKVGGDPYLDWPGGGLTSPATVEGDRAYVVTNRAEVVCLDLNGQANGNDGPFREEASFSAPPGRQPVPVGQTDADILWVFDMVKGAGIYRHDASHASILVHGRHLYLNSSNGVDNTHRRIRAPDAPGLVVLDKQTGRLVARDRERMAPRTFHCTWSSPAMGEVHGRRLLFFGGGDGICYAFDALPQDAAPQQPPVTLKKVWSFDCDPNAPKEDVHRYVGNRRNSPSNIMGMPVFHNGRVYVAAGGDIWWGKRRAWLKCIDAAKTGDVTRSAEVWSHELKSHCCSTPSVHEGLVYIPDCSGLVHCLDAQTGRSLWTHQAKGAIWASTLVADGKVYVGSRRSDFWVLAAGREKRILATIEMDSPISAPPTAANGMLFVATMRRLYAVQAPAGGLSDPALARPRRSSNR